MLQGINRVGAKLIRAAAIALGRVGVGSGLLLNGTAAPAAPMGRGWYYDTIAGCPTAGCPTVAGSTAGCPTVAGPTVVVQLIHNLLRDDAY